MNREQCEGCAYFLSGGGGKAESRCGGIRFCHHMLYTGKRREVGENEICLSRSETRKKVAKAFSVLTQQM